MDSLLRRRLYFQGLLLSRFQSPAEAVTWLGAVQSQDYAGAKWALAQRVPGLTDAALDAAFDAGEFLRTHVLRPTWHFVLPQDIRWMLDLTAPRIKMAMAGYNRQLELDDQVFTQSATAIEKALGGGKSLTRPELLGVLAQAGVDAADAMRMNHILIRAELDCLICSGPRTGNPADAGHDRSEQKPQKQQVRNQTYALLAERAPNARTLTREESLAELARRYFTSHGPATIKDYVWWSGLTVADAREGIALLGDALTKESIDGVDVWFSGEAPMVKRAGPLVHLLPNYDEYIVAYTDRSAIFNAENVHILDPRGNILFSNTIVVDGRIVGVWRRTFKKGAAVMELTYETPPTPEETAAIDTMLARYSEFLGMPVVLS